MILLWHPRDGRKKTPLYKSKSGHISREESTSSFDARLPGMWSSNTLHSPPPSTLRSFSSQLSESTVSVSGCGIVQVLAIGLANIYPWHQYCLITVHYRWHLWHLHLTSTCIQTCIVLKIKNQCILWTEVVSRQLSVRQIQLAEKPQSVIMCSAGDHICMSIFAGSHVLDWTLAPAGPCLPRHASM